MAAAERHEVSQLFSDSITAALAEQLLGLDNGSRLPSERELSEEMGVSRTALRDRLSRLESIGFLERRTGAGTFVRGLQPANLTEALALGLLSSDLSSDSLRTVRIGLERQAAREAATQRTESHLASLSASLERMQSCDSAETMLRVDAEFHRTVLSASGSPALLYFIEALDGVLEATEQQRHYRMTLLMIDQALTTKMHRRLYTAILKGQQNAAMKAVDDYVDWLQTQVEYRAEAGRFPVTAN